MRTPNFTKAIILVSLLIALYSCKKEDAQHHENLTPTTHQEDITSANLMKSELSHMSHYNDSLAHHGINHHHISHYDSLLWHHDSLFWHHHTQYHHNDTAHHVHHTQNHHYQIDSLHHHHHDILDSLNHLPHHHSH